ncbi:hypothetical protein MCEMIH15_01276 [Caulobacteraceae bacterium]
MTSTRDVRHVGPPRVQLWCNIGKSCRSQMRRLLQFKAGSGVLGAVLQDFNISLAVVVVMPLLTETAFAAGYVAGVGLLLAKNFATVELDWVPFFKFAAFVMSAIGTLGIAALAF